MQDRSSERKGRPQPTPIVLLREQSLDDFVSRVDFSKVARGVLRRIWIIVLLATLSALAFGYLSHYLSSRFVASSYLLYEEDKSKTDAGVFPLTRISQASSIDMVTLSANLNAVRAILGLELTEKQLRKMIEVVPPPAESNLLNIKVTADSPGLAIDIANTLATVVVKNTKDYAKRQLNTAHDYYRQQLDAQRDKLASKIKEITEFQKTHPSFEFGSSGSVILKSFSDLEARRQNAVEVYNTQLIQYENLRREAERIPDQVVKYTEIDNPLKQRIAQAELNLIEAKTRYAPENPRIKTLEAEVAQLKKLLLEPSQQQANNVDGAAAEYIKNPMKEQLNMELLSLRGKLRSAQKLKEDIEDELSKQSKALVSLPEDQVAYTRLQDSREQMEYEVKGTESVLKTVDALMSVGKSGLEVYQTADKAVPNESLLIQLLPLIGFFLGAGAGLIVAFLVELSDRRLRTAKEVEASYHLRCLSTIPEFRFFSLGSGEVQMQFFIRTIEESIEKAAAGMSAFSLAILSSTRGEGKSTLVYLLTRYYQKLGKRCIAFELDGPVKGFDSDNEGEGKQSLEAYLVDDASLEEIVIPGAVDRIQSNQSSEVKELLKSGRLNQLLEKLKQHYEVIILDVPGLVEADYAANLAEAVDFSLMVIGSSRTPSNAIEVALKDLERHEVCPLGVVLNRVLRIYIDDIRVKSETKKARVGLIARLQGWLRRG